MTKKHIFIQQQIKRPRANKHALIKTIQCSNFPNAIVIRIAESISPINIFYYSEQFLSDVTPYFLRAVQFSFGLLCRAQLVVINYLISKRKQHTFRTFGQIGKLHSNQRVLPQAFDMLVRFKSFKLKQCENKLSSNDRHRSL